VSIMDELAIKRRLEKTLHTRITWAEWADLVEQRYVRDYQPGQDDWEALCMLVNDALSRLRRHIRRTQREQAGELDVEAELQPEVEVDADAPTAPATLTLSGRTFARSQALGSLNRLQTGGRSSGRAPIDSFLLPRGGVDGTLAQWVYVVAVELWVSAEEVANNYRTIQKTLSAESNPLKTSERAFEVAAFVWDNERVHGMRPPWPILCERWNNWPLTEPFKKWQSFHKAFSRGARATVPRYNATNEQITNEVRSAQHSVEKALDDWAAKVRE
jgi:hypothetical protein